MWSSDSRIVRSADVSFHYVSGSIFRVPVLNGIFAFRFSAVIMFQFKFRIVWISTLSRGEVGLLYTADIHPCFPVGGSSSYFQSKPFGSKLGSEQTSCVLRPVCLFSVSGYPPRFCLWYTCVRGVRVEVRKLRFCSIRPVCFVQQNHVNFVVLQKL